MLIANMRKLGPDAAIALLGTAPRKGAWSVNLGLTREYSS